MQLVWGNLFHNVFECAITFSKEILQATSGIPYGAKETWTISGFFQANTQQLVTAGVTSIEQAYQFNNQTIQLLDNAGNVARFMAGRSPLGGTRVLRFNYPDNGASTAEWSTFRRYEVVVEGMYPLPGLGDVLLAWVESLSFEGCGPIDVHLQPIRGLPQKQRVAEASPFRATQNGRAIGLKAWPTPPAPIWPGAEQRNRRHAKRMDPKRTGGTIPVYTEFETEWAYFFEDASPLIGNPTLWL